jgi:Zn finger protein HypA/HybF involved in hydrogenase expression
MKFILYSLAALLGIFGFIFIVGAQGSIGRIAVGIILFVAGGALVYVSRVQPEPSQTTIVQKIDLSGEMNLQEIRCRSCDAPLSKESIKIEGGAIFVNCEYCGATYQMEEEAKW